MFFICFIPKGIWSNDKELERLGIKSMSVLQLNRTTIGMFPPVMKAVFAMIMPMSYNEYDPFYDDKKATDTIYVSKRNVYNS